MDRQNSDRETFDNQWRKAMNQTEITPSDRVWFIISKTLDVKKYKYRSQLYGLVAAVAVLITVGVSIQSDWISSRFNFKSNYFAKQSNQNELEVQIEPIDIDRSMGPHVQLNEFLYSDLSQFNLIYKDQKHEKTSSFPVIDKEIIVPDKKDYQLLDKTSIVKTSISPVQAHYPNFLKETSIKGKGKGVQSWAGLNIGGSSFNPNYEMTDAGDILARGGFNPGFLEDQEGTVTSLDENMMVGVNRKIEVNLGMTIKERFVLEGALQYVQTQLVQQSNFMIENISYPISMASPNISTVPEIRDKSVEKMQEVSYTTTETELENRIDFASVPLRAGFIFLDQRLSLRFNAGLVTNFYLGNIHRSLDDQTPIAEFRNNDNSLYRNISFSGQTGVSLGYRLIQNIDVTFEPNYTQSFQSITRSYMGFSSVPNGFGVMAGIRYNFN